MSTSSASSNPNVEECRPPVSYENDQQELLRNENDSKKIRMVLGNRLESSGRSVMGTVVLNHTTPLSIFTTIPQKGNSEKRCNRLINLKGNSDRTMVYSKLLEDSACHPYEFRTYCEQCHNQHVAHNMVLDNEIMPCQVVNIEFVDIRDGGIFANNLVWLTALIEKGCMARCFVFWNAGTTFLLSGGSVNDLLAKNKVIEDYVAEMDVQIRHVSVNLKHEFILVPLVFTRDTCDLEIQAMDKVLNDTGSLPVIGQAFPKFLDYNAQVMNLVKDKFPTSEPQVVDPNLLLAVKSVQSTTMVYGEPFTTVKYQFRTGDNPDNPRLMDESTRQGYFVNLCKWVLDNFEKETKDEMTRKQVPSVSPNLSMIKQYTKDTRIG